MVNSLFLLHEFVQCSCWRVGLVQRNPFSPMPPSPGSGKIQWAIKYKLWTLAIYPMLNTSRRGKINSMNLLHVHGSQGEDQLHEPASCTWRQSLLISWSLRPSQGFEHHLVPALQLFLGLLCESDQCHGDEWSIMRALLMLRESMTYWVLIYSEAKKRSKQWNRQIISFRISYYLLASTSRQ
jgi:hypothetical protein